MIKILEDEHQSAWAKAVKTAIKFNNG